MEYRETTNEDRNRLYGKIIPPRQNDIQFYECDCSCGCGCPSICLDRSDSELESISDELLLVK